MTRWDAEERGAACESMAADAVAASAAPATRRPLPTYADLEYWPDEDPDGYDALLMGSDCYSQAMSFEAAEEHAQRIWWFQAAELLYLAAAQKGEVYADLNLGYVYSYDRCEGNYVAAAGDSACGAAPFDREAHAYRHYRRAAEAGVAEACYKLGDLLRDGRGCETDLDQAFVWFQRAYEGAVGALPVVWGSAALRLGRAYEEGEGCEQSFSQALTWYERAVTGLDISVRSGSQWYRGALRQARRGLARTQQELDGRY